MTRHTGKITNFTHTGLMSTSSDGIQNITTIKNSLGQVVSQSDNGGTVAYTYFADGNLRQSDYNGIIIDIEQDGWGRKTKLTDPSAGTYTYTYNDFGELKKETSPNGTTTYTLDDFGKVTEKVIVGSGGNPTNTKSSYTYNANTKLLTTARYDDYTGGYHSIYNYVYDNYNRPTLKEESGFHAYYHQAYTYDSFGRVEKELYIAINTSDGKRSEKWIKNTYKNGHHHQIIDFETGQVLLQVNSTNPKGQLKNARFGSSSKSLSVNRTYDEYGYPTQIKYYEQAGKVLEGQPPLSDTNYLILNYQFEASTGNLLSRSNSLFNWTESFEYDSQDRLASYTNATGGQASQDYDERGRITENGLGTYEYSTDKPYQNTAVDLSSSTAGYYLNREGIFHDGMEAQCGWTTYNNPSETSAYDATKSRTGAYSLKIDNTIGASEIVVFSEKWIPVNNAVATEYTFSTWVYSDSAPAEIFLFSKTATETNPFTSLSQEVGTTTGEWYLLTKTIMIPANIKFLQLRVDNNGSGKVWFDDIRLTKTGTPPTTD